MSPVYPARDVHREPLKKNFETPYVSYSALVAKIKSMAVKLTVEEEAALTAAVAGNPTADQVRLLRDVVEEDGTGERLE